MVKYKNSKPVRVDMELLDLINIAKIDISNSIHIEPAKISGTLATRKLSDWAKLGKRVEDQKKKSPNTKWTEFMNSIT